MTRNICRSVGSNFLHLYQLLVCSGKSQLSNYVNAHCLQISIWTWFMSYHVETTLCHDITTYDIYRGSPTPMLWYGINLLDTVQSTKGHTISLCTV